MDVPGALARIAESGVVGAEALQPFEDPEIPASFAVVGTRDDLVVGFSSRCGGDAALGAVAAALRRVDEQGFAGEVVALAPQWTSAARRRLSLLGTPRLPFRAVAASALAENGGEVEGEAPDAPLRVPLSQAAAALEGAAERDLFLRASASLEGLAAKHGGSLRGVPGGAELVLLARRAARLRTQGDVAIETFRPEATERLSADSLASAMDRLEGLLRKQLNDRRIRDSEEGLRAHSLQALARELRLRGVVPWPLPGSDPEVLDWVGVLPDGRPAAGALRQRLDLPALGALLDAVAVLGPALPALLAGAGAPLRLVTPRLCIAACEFDAAVLRVLPGLALEVVAYDIQTRRGQGPELVPRALERKAPRSAVGPREAAPAGARPAAPRRPAVTAAEIPFEAPSEPPLERSSGFESPRERPSGFERPPEGPPSWRADRETPEAAAEARPPSPPRPRFDEVSFFDLDDGNGGETEPAERSPRRRRRSRRRRSGRRPGAVAEGGSSDEGEPEPEAAGQPRAEERERREEPGEEEALDDLDLSGTLAPLDEDVPDMEAGPEASYEEDEEDEEPEEVEEESGPAERLPEREARRRARLAKAAPEIEPAPQAPRPPRRRAAIVAHADRDSLIAALLLARDMRLLEGFWVYPQSELMTFFRSVATDLREETPICVVGFAASPARETLQAASLYAGRLDWFDHHDWPPEDLEAMGSAIGRERLVVHPGTGSSLPAVLSVRSRRSRFSDRLVELATGNFTHHDYDRWGRVWWTRLAAIAQRSGERRSDLDPLLAGRPSDLAREAADAAAPPLPPEACYVSERDFRLIHFGGYALVVVPVPAELDLHLTSRIARERYAAPLSVAHRTGSELVVLGGGEDGRARRGVDLARMVEHLASKHVWIEALPSADHVARLRVRDLVARPERLDDVIREIGMGRSILEG